MVRLSRSKQQQKELEAKASGSAAWKKGIEEMDKVGQAGTAKAGAEHAGRTVQFDGKHVGVIGHPSGRPESTRVVLLLCLGDRGWRRIKGKGDKEPAVQYKACWRLE
jgi:hypothetical protein